MRITSAPFAATMGIVAALALAVTDTEINAQKQKQTVVVNLTIDPGAVDNPNTVLPDGVASTYVDWRLGGYERTENLKSFSDVVDWCVESGVEPG